MSKVHAGFVAAADVATATVHARGALRRTAASSLLGTVEVLLETGHRDLTIDLHHVPEIDDAGVRLLAVLQHDLWTHGGTLRIVNAMPEVRERLLAGHVTSDPSVVARTTTRSSVPIGPMTASRSDAGADRWNSATFR
jgi:anti-anti-sigma regulatory factor